MLKQVIHKILAVCLCALCAFTSVAECGQLSRSTLAGYVNPNVQIKAEVESDEETVTRAGLVGWNPTFLGEQYKYVEVKAPNVDVIQDSETALVYIHDLFYYITETLIPLGKRIQISIPRETGNYISAYSQGDYDPRGYLETVREFLEESNYMVNGKNINTFLSVVTEWLDFNERTEIVLRSGKHDDLSCFKYDLMGYDIKKLLVDDEEKLFGERQNMFSEMRDGFVSQLYTRIQNRRDNGGEIGKPLISYEEAKRVRGALKYMYDIGLQLVSNAQKKTITVREAEDATRAIKRTGLDYITMTLEDDTFPLQVVFLDSLRRHYKASTVFESYYSRKHKFVKGKYIDSVWQVYPPKPSKALVRELRNVFVKKEASFEGYTRFMEWITLLLEHAIRVHIPKDNPQLNINYTYMREIFGLAISNSVNVAREKSIERFETFSRRDYERYYRMLSAMYAAFERENDRYGDPDIVSESFTKITVYNGDKLKEYCERQDDYWQFFKHLLRYLPEGEYSEEMVIKMIQAEIDERGNEALFVENFYEHSPKLADVECFKVWRVKILEMINKYDKGLASDWERRHMKREILIYLFTGIVSPKRGLTVDSLEGQVFERLHPVMNEVIAQYMGADPVVIEPVDIHLSVDESVPQKINMLIWDTVGGISDAWLLEETYMGSGRQNVTRLNVSRRLKDTGLGIAKMYQAVKACGGKMWLTNVDVEGNDLRLDQVDQRKGFKISLWFPADVVINNATLKSREVFRAA